MEQSLHQFRKDPLFCISPDDSIADAIELAKEAGVHHLPVISNGGLVGLICTCDMQEAPPRSPVEKWMRKAITLSLEHTRADAVELMNECAIGSVILLDDEVPQGIVTRGDLVDSRPPSALVEEISRCSCCGTTSHLRTTLTGRTLCVECRKLPPRSQLHIHD